MANVDMDTDSTCNISIRRTSAYSSNLAQELLSLKDDGAFTDFTIRTGSHAFRCHKLVLAANSPVLRGMLRSGMAESSSQEMRLDHIPAEVIVAILDYMYTGEAAALREDLILDLVYAADYLQMLELRKICIDHTHTILSKQNVVSWFKTAVKMNLADLRIACVKLLSANLNEIQKGCDFSTLNVEELLEYFSDAVLDEDSADPDHLLEAAMSWTKEDIHNRLEYIDDLLQSLPLTKCSQECL